VELSISWISFDLPLNEYYHSIGFIPRERNHPWVSEDDIYSAQLESLDSLLSEYWVMPELVLYRTEKIWTVLNVSIT